MLDLQKPCIIEPKYGFAITQRPLRLIRHALNPKCRKFKETRPRVRQLFSELIPRQVDVPILISLRDFNETNYWHFFNDVLSKLLLLNELDLFQDVPVLISRQLAERPFFEYFRSSCPLLQREIIVQDRSSINVGRLIIVQTQECHPRNVDYLAKLIPASVEPDERRVFLTRGQGVSRSLANENEIDQLLKKYGFEKVDTVAMPFREQVRLF